MTDVTKNVELVPAVAAPAVKPEVTKEAVQGEADLSEGPAK